MLGAIKLIFLGTYFVLMVMVTEIIRFVLGIFSRDKAQISIYRLMPVLTWPLGTLMGIRLSVYGRENLPKGDGHLITTNHLGYIELFALLRLTRCSFVAKEEIGGWPFIGNFASAAGTIFVNREQGGLSSKYIREVTAHLEKKMNVWFAPEKTTADGTWLRPFSSALFVAANRAQRPVVPAVFMIRKVNGKPVTPELRQNVAWFDIDGESIPFEKQLWKFLNTWSVNLDLHILPPVMPDYDDSDIRERRAFSDEIHERMEQVLEEFEPDFHRE